MEVHIVQLDYKTVFTFLPSRSRTLSERWFLSLSPNQKSLDSKNQPFQNEEKLKERLK